MTLEVCFVGVEVALPGSVGERRENGFIFTAGVEGVFPFGSMLDEVIYDYDSLESEQDHLLLGLLCEMSQRQVNRRDGRRTRRMPTLSLARPTWQISTPQELKALLYMV